MNIANELLIEKAKEGYTVCYADTCPLRTQCLRWLVGQHCRLSDVSLRPEDTLRQRYDSHLYKRYAQTTGARSSQWHHSPNQPYLLFRVSQWLAPHSACFAREDPQVVSRQRMDGGGEVRQLCRGLRLVITVTGMA